MRGYVVDIELTARLPDRRETFGDARLLMTGSWTVLNPLVILDDIS